MIKKRKQYSPEFKAKVALAAIRNEASVAEIAGIVARQNELRTAIDEIVADIEGGTQ